MILTRKDQDTERDEPRKQSLGNIIPQKITKIKKKKRHQQQNSLSKPNKPCAKEIAGVNNLLKDDKSAKETENKTDKHAIHKSSLSKSMPRILLKDSSSSPRTLISGYSDSE